MSEENTRILIRGGRVLTMADGRNEEQLDILVEGESIVLVAPRIEAGDAQVVDATGKIVLPGFVDTHRHTWQTQLRTVAADWSLYDYLADMRMSYSALYTPEDAQLGNYAGALEAVSAGVTTVVDHCHIINSPDHADQALDGLEASGIRAIFCYGLFPNPGQLPFRPGIDVADLRTDATRIRRNRLTSDSGRLLFGVASEIEALPFEAIADELAFARELGAKRISCHVAMGCYDQGQRHVERLAERGLLSNDLLFVHGAAFTDRELGLIRDCGAGISSTPETELQMGMGFPVAERARLSGAFSSLGIDIVSNNTGDMFAQMRLMLQATRALENLALERQGLAPRTIRLTARDVLRMATIGGAEALGLADRIGSIESGKSADLILIRTDSLHMSPADNAIAAVVLYANESDVDSVFVAGRPLKHGGVLLNVDMADLTRRLRSSRTRLSESFAQIDHSMVRSITEKFFSNLQ